MILAAGLGTRLRPLSELCAKPAMPVRGIPVIAHTLALLAKHAVEQVVVNLHHLPDSVRAAVDRHCPDRLTVHYSYEPVLLGTGGGMRAVADFLRESDPSLVLAGDMLLDVDLGALVAHHRHRGDRYTLLLRDGDPRQRTFGTIGLDDEGCVRRIGSRFDLGGETRAALFTGVRVVASRCLRDWPSREAFEDLTDWLAPSLSAGARDIRGHWLADDACVWEPVGTPAEYLSVNLQLPPLSYREEIEREEIERMQARAEASPALVQAEGQPADVVVGAGAKIEPGARLRRVVVWPGERVPGNARAQDGVFAGGRFHDCGPQPAAVRQSQGGTRGKRPQPG